MMRTLTAIVLLIVAGGVFILYTKPTYDSVGATSAQIGQYDTALTKAAELQQLKQNLLAKYNAISPTDLDRLQKMLPDHVDNIALIMDVENLANHYGMTFSNVQISAPNADSGASSAVGAISSGSGKKYDTITISFSTQGTYDSLITFMKGLEANLRVVDFQTITLSGPGQSQQSQGAGQVAAAGESASKVPIYSLSVTIKTYWLK